MSSYGATRVVRRIGDAAVKMPRLRRRVGRLVHVSPSRWGMFLSGLQANLQERYWWTVTRGDARLCPILFADPIGLFVVMRWADDMDDDEPLPDQARFDGLPYDPARQNHGWLGGQLVLRDYGS